MATSISNYGRHKTPPGKLECLDFPNHEYFWILRGSQASDLLQYVPNMGYRPKRLRYSLLLKSVVRYVIGFAIKASLRREQQDSGREF